MKNFAEFLRSEDKIAFENMMNPVQLYASYASTLASPIKGIPLLISILFAHHKMLWKHEKQLARIESLLDAQRSEATTAPDIRQLQGSPALGPSD